MMKRLNLFIVMAIFVTSCNNRGKQADLEQLKTELIECRKTVEELQNTPQIRLAKGQKYFADKDFEKAKIELSALIEKYNGTDEAQKAQSIVTEIEKIEKITREEAERKRNLGFKAIQETNSVKIAPITLNFHSVDSKNEWTFEYDKYGYYRYRKAERGNIFICADVSITSEEKETSIPLISVYELSGGTLNILGIMYREFFKDPNSDYSNVDFKYVSTVNLSHALEIPIEKLKNHPIFVVVKKTNCSLYEHGYYLDTDTVRVIETYNNQCHIKSKLTVEDFDEEYVLIKILNKGKL